MFGLIRGISSALAVLCCLNVFLHVYSLKWFTKRKIAGMGFGLLLAGINFLAMRDIFSTLWMAAAHVTVITLAWDFLALIFRVFGKENRVRRALCCFRAHGGAFLLAALYIAYGLINIRIVWKTEYEFRHPNVKENFTVALISDSHLSASMSAERLLSVMEKAISGGADMIVLAGDITDERTGREDFMLLCEGLRAMRAPKGIYFVFGNHDGAHYGGSVTEEEMEDLLTQAGVTVLTDETVLLDGWLRIAGRKEAGGERMSAAALLKDADADAEYMIICDHQPAETVLCAEAGADLMLSGHTHNGQIFPVNLISVLFGINEVEYGHERIGGMDCVVSSGVSGWGCAFRTAGKCEYVLISLEGEA